MLYTFFFIFYIEFLLDEQKKHNIWHYGVLYVVFSYIRIYIIHESHGLKIHITFFFFASAQGNAPEECDALYFGSESCTIPSIILNISSRTLILYKNALPK